MQQRDNRASSIEQWTLGVAKGIGDVEHDADRCQTDCDRRAIANRRADRRANGCQFEFIVRAELLVECRLDSQLLRRTLAQFTHADDDRVVIRRLNDRALEAIVFKNRAHVFGWHFALELELPVGATREVDAPVDPKEDQ
jgi:hypothetical protein